MKNLHNLFLIYKVNLTEGILSLIKKEYCEILIPSKAESKLKYISQKDLLQIHPDIEFSKELILMVLKNFSNTYVISRQNNATESQKMGYKRLSSEILKGQLRYCKKIISPYSKILQLLIKYDIIEKGKNYVIGERCNEYRLTKTYFGKGVVSYKIKSKAMLKKNKNVVDENLEKVLKCPIAREELINRGYINFPSEKEVKEHLKKKVKEGYVNKKGKKLVSIGKNPDRYDEDLFVSIEEYLEIFNYLSKTLTVPIVTESDNGNRVITAFNFMPSIIRELCTFSSSNSKLVEVDYSCLHPNIVQYLYGGYNKEEISHDKVSEYLGVDRKIAKVGHLSFFNQEWEKMIHNPLFKYYSDNEPKMMQNIYESKLLNGHKETSRSCFEFETELMRSNVRDLKEEGIRVLYCFDALYCVESEKEFVKEVMNRNAKKYNIKSIAK